MKKGKSYHDEQNKANIQKMRLVLETLPHFCRQFFRGITEQTSTRTRLAYAYDLRVFFEYMEKNNSICQQTAITDYPLDILDQIKREDIEEYLEYISLYEKDGREISNDERGKSRKLATLRSFYNFFYRNEMIKTNPAGLVPMPKQHDKEIVRLDIDEVVILLNQVEEGTSLTAAQRRYHAKTKVRDVALLTLLLGTGIRVSECVGLNINDLDFKNNGMKIVRKGGFEAVIYFGDEVQNALVDYLEKRSLTTASPGHEEALFLSLQNRRITVRSVENIVKKYAATVTPLKNITPHKLRSTYGTSLYRETGDIYLVADVLGHKDVNTTRKHYAAIDEDRRRMAARAVKLREE
ncbi:MAG: tyrosine-type recombinase/integrase [Lachnospiraceae bacterium]|jgi:site-specific recombinase XerD|nr:tyrosine-type recombinase/integrase [Lachnospiraceae bacterium]